MTGKISDWDLPWCSADGVPNQYYKIRVRDLAPAQFAVGKAEVQVRAARMLKKYMKKPQHLHDYITVRPVPVVIRDDRFYLVDHHHMARALHEALHEELGKDIRLVVEVVANLSMLSEAHFWKTMHARNWVYLFDHFGGGPQLPQSLPEKIKDMEFDPYRSLAWIVRAHHGCLKDTAPFAEFRWANFFRERILLSHDVLIGKHGVESTLYEVDENGRLELTDDGMELVEEAVYLSSIPEARGLPGFRNALC